MLLAFVTGLFYPDLAQLINPVESDSTVLVRNEGPALSETELNELIEPSKLPGSDRSGVVAYTSEELHTIRLFEAAAPSVCYITTSTLRRSFFSRDVSEIPSGSGSGFVWDRKGHIITNFHVIKGASKATVTLGDGSAYEATLVGQAPEKDLAVLKIDAPAGVLTQIPLGTSENLLVGQNVYAIGNPFGLDRTLTTGIVSALDREINSVAGVPIRGAIQTDAAINPGNSGGPLLDSQGKLIGVNTAIYSPSGASAGIGFSIPVDIVRLVVPDLIQYGQVRRPTLGVELTRPLRNVNGVTIYSVIEGGASDRAGLIGLSRDGYGSLILGDIITSINGRPVRSANDLYLELERYEPGEIVEVGHVREEREYVTEVRLDSSVN
ncbi:2-alkenal reductase [Lewinellaceae bacterium SD302]|nr:2-alkenal reductase [Lewinellaceae bacterium SD302]